MPIMPEPATACADAAPLREGRTGIGGGGGSGAWAVLFRKVWERKGVRAVAVAFFFGLGAVVAICAEASDAVTAEKMAVDTRSVESLMVGTYLERTDRREVHRCR
jgi:hypothetical protein